MCVAGGYRPIPLVIAAGNHRIIEPSDLTDHLLITCPTPPPNNRARLVFQYFESSLHTYLKGIGHVASDSATGNFIPPESEIEQGRNATILRAELFLKAATDSEILPVDPEWKLQVRYSVYQANPRF